MDAYNRGFNYLIRKCGYKILGPTESLRKECVNLKNKKDKKKLLEENFPKRFFLTPDKVTDSDDLKVLELMKSINISGSNAPKMELYHHLDYLGVPHEFPKLPIPKDLVCR